MKERPEWLHQLLGSLHQCMFYGSASTDPPLHERGQFGRIAPAGLKESHPHDVQVVSESPNRSPTAERGRGACASRARWMSSRV